MIAENAEQKNMGQWTWMAGIYIRNFFGPEYIPHV